MASIATLVFNRNIYHTTEQRKAALVESADEEALQSPIPTFPSGRSFWLALLGSGGAFPLDHVEKRRSASGPIPVGADAGKS